MPPCDDADELAIVATQSINTSIAISDEGVFLILTMPDMDIVYSKLTYAEFSAMSDSVLRRVN